VSYVDGFLLVVPKKNVKKYVAIAKKAGDVWREHGALEYREAVGDDLNIAGVGSFTKLLKLKANETAVFSWIVFKSRAHRDRVNAKVMKDPRLNELCSSTSMPFDIKRMNYGGFQIVVAT